MSWAWAISTSGSSAIPNYQALGVKRVRYFIRWDAIRNPAALSAADQYVFAANAAGAKVLMHISTNDLTPGKAKLPTVAQYKRDVGALVKRYKPLGVTEWGTWNEANHTTQPTFRSARRAAQFYVAMKGFCSGCTIVGLDVLDQRSTRVPSIDFRNYISAFFRAAGSAGRTMTVVGIHNYSEVNRRYTKNTRDIISAVRKYNRRAKFWYTETGGVAEFSTAFPCNVNRQANRTQYMFDLAKRFKTYVKRRLQLQLLRHGLLDALRRRPGQRQRHAAPGVQRLQGEPGEVQAVAESTSSIRSARVGRASPCQRSRRAGH